MRKPEDPETRRQAEALRAAMPLTSKVLFLTTGTLFGAAFPITRFLTSYVDALWMVLGRLVVGAVFLFGLIHVASLGPLRRLSRRTVLHLAVGGTLNIALPWCLMAVVLRTVPASVVAVFFAGVSPLLTFAVGVLVGGERWRARRAAGLLVSLLGVAVLSKGAASSVSPVHVAALVVAVVAISVGAVYVSTHLRQVPVATVALGQLSAALPVVAVACLLAGNDVLLAPMKATSWVAWSALGVMNTALTYLLFFLLLQRAGPVTAAATNYVTVIVGVVAGLLFLAEPVTWSLLLGGVLILLGMSQSTRRSAHHSATQRTPRAPTE